MGESLVSVSYFEPLIRKFDKKISHIWRSPSPPIQFYCSSTVPPRSPYWNDKVHHGPPKLKIFEVDQPEVQVIKRSKLPKSISNGENIIYVSIDFNNQSLKEQLLDAGFDKSKSTIYTLEGVSQYIPKEALSSTLKELATLNANSNSKIFISYVNKLLLEDSKACFGMVSKLNRL